MSIVIVPYEEGAAVQKAVALATELGKRQRITAWHQGAEETQPTEGQPGNHRTYTGQLSPAYNKDPGGTPAQREIVAEFCSSALGLPATRNNTFLDQNNGRWGLNQAIHIAAAPCFVDWRYRPVGYVPARRWDMVTDEFNYNYVAPWGYYLAREGTPENIKAAHENHRMQAEGTNELGVILYHGEPSNPESFEGSPEQIRQIHTFTDSVNLERQAASQPPLVDLGDFPYWGGAPVVEDGVGGWLKTAYNEAYVMNSPTPGIIIVGFSKGIGAARPGVHALVFTNSEMAAAYAVDSKARTSLSYEPAFFDAVVGTLHPNSYPDLKTHFRNMRGNYERNLVPVQEHLGHLLQDGGIGMVRSLGVPDDALNKLPLDSNGQPYRYADGSVFEVRTTRHALAYIANRYGVITVDQTIKAEPRQGIRAENLARIALKSPDPNVAVEGAQGFAQGIEDLQAAPAL